MGCSLSQTAPWFYLRLVAILVLVVVLILVAALVLLVVLILILVIHFVSSMTIHYGIAAMLV